jgi:hypothetical protein
MCGGSEGKIRDKAYDVYLGYYGGTLTINGITLSVTPNEHGPGKSIEGLDDMRKYLKSYKKDELVEFIIDIIMHGDEG